MSKLPHFPYHRNPIASGSVRETDAPCECCGHVRGFAYEGVVYSQHSPETLCPWCIADGSALTKYDAFFFDAEFVDDDFQHVDLPIDKHIEVFRKTIGFSTCNPIGWWVHCGEPAEFIRRDEPYDMVFECRVCQKQHVIEDFD